MNALLKAKHWQIFIYILAAPITFQFYTWFTMANQISSENPMIDPESIMEGFKYFPLMMLIFIFTLISWFWSMGVGLQNLIPQEISMNVSWFKAFALFPLIYISLISIGIHFLLGNISSMSPYIILIIIPLHLFSIFCLFYCIYFIAKTIKTAELQRETTFSDFIGEFFLIMFYPIGVWILQPNVNSLVKD